MSAFAGSHEFAHYPDEAEVDRWIASIWEEAESLDCTAEVVHRKTLFEKLPGTRSFTLLRGTGHRYTRAFIHLASAWFRMYA